MNPHRFAGIMFMILMVCAFLFLGKVSETQMMEARTLRQDQKIMMLEARIHELEQALAELEAEKQALDAENASLKEYIRALQPIAHQILQHNPYLGDEAMKVAAQVHASSERWGVDPYLIVALGSAESDWRLNARGRSGEYGPLQVLPATFRLLGGQNPNDWRETIDIGVRYFAMCLEKAGGNERLALAYYNSGPNRSAKQATAISGKYANRVLSRRRT